MDSGGRATQEAKAESRSLRGVNEESRTELMPLSRKKYIFRDALGYIKRGEVISTCLAQ